MEDPPSQEDTGGATTPTPTVAYSTEDTGLGITASNQPLTASDPPLELFNNHIEPDSLMMTSAELDKALWDKEDEIVQAFENDVEVTDRGTSACDIESMSASRASVDSQRSVSFFVDLKDQQNMMAQSVMVTPRPTSGRRTKSQNGDRLTQSMYVRSDSQSSGVSFFVDISETNTPTHNPKDPNSRKQITHSFSREEADQDLDELSEDMRVKSSLLLAQNLEQTKAFFGKLKNYVDFLSMPNYSKEELRQKRKMAINISRLMFEEEQKLKKGQSLSSMGELDKMLLGSHGGLVTRPPNQGGQANRRPVSAYCTSATGKQPHNNNRGQDQQDQLQVDKPVLRRERTFDLDPKPNNAAATKIVEVNIDQPIDLHDEASNGEIFNTNGNDNVADGQTLQMFQQQRLYHTMRLKREIAKLEYMEKDIAQKTSEIGPDTNGKPAAGSATRQCWSQTQSKPNKSKTSFKAEYERKVNNHQDSLESNSSTFSWFVPDEQSQRPNTSSGLPAHNKSRGSQTNQSLFRQYYEKKDKGVTCRDRPQAFFIECTSQDQGEQTNGGSGKPRPKSAIERRNSKQSCKNNNTEFNNTTRLLSTNIIDLETETLPDDKNLQEALRRKRPDYIEKTRTREQDRLAKSVVANKQASLSARSTPIKATKAHTASTTSVPQAKTIYGSQLGVNGRPEIRSSRIPVQQISAVKKNNTQQLLNNGQKRPNSSNAKKVSMTQSRNRTTKQPPSQPATLKAVQ